MLERLGLQELVDETLTIKRIPRATSIYQFVLETVLAIYVGFARLNHIRFVAQDPEGERVAWAEHVLAVSMG